MNHRCLWTVVCIRFVGHRHSPTCDTASDSVTCRWCNRTEADVFSGNPETHGIPVGFPGKGESNSLFITWQARKGQRKQVESWTGQCCKNIPRIFDSLFIAKFQDSNIVFLEILEPNFYWGMFSLLMIKCLLTIHRSVPSSPPLLWFWFLHHGCLSGTWRVLSFWSELWFAGDSHRRELSRCQSPRHICCGCDSSAASMESVFSLSEIGGMSTDFQTQPVGPTIRLTAGTVLVNIPR